MCQPALPLGCGPANSATSTPAGTSYEAPGAWHRNTGPSVSFVSAARPRRKSSVRPASTSAGGGACGRVSVAVTKMACGRASAFGTRPNGRMRNESHSPASISSARTSASSSASAGFPVKPAKRIRSSEASSSSITTEISARRSPRCSSTTRPAPGDVVRTPGFFLSSNSGWPSATRSPGPTSIVGLRPWVSRPSAATRVTAGAASMRGAGSPASGRSSPLELL